MGWLLCKWLVMVDEVSRSQRQDKDRQVH